jgi:rare lipoprotein A
VRVEYVGPARIEGSDDRVLEATLRQDEPAPAPGTTKLAALRIVPVAMTAPPRTRFASIATTASLPQSATLTYASTISSTDDGSDEFLTGRGLY